MLSQVICFSRNMQTKQMSLHVSIDNTADILTILVKDSVFLK